MKLIGMLIGFSLVLAVRVSAAQTEIWDLAEDWSDSDNPNGVWSYELTPQEQVAVAGQMVMTQSGNVEVGEVRLQAARTNLLPNHTQSWFSANSPDFPNGPQPAWHVDDSRALGLCLSTGTSNLDFPKGRTGGHTPFLIRWTAPRDMTARIMGGFWMPRDSKRPMVFSIGKTLAESGETITLLEETPIPYPNTGFTASNPFAFSHAAKTRYGYSASPLSEIALHKGDSLWIYVKGRDAGVNDFAGVDLTVVPVESPASGRIFSTDRPSSQWVEISALGFFAPVTGIIYRRDTPATNGMALGGIDTGCIDLETSGLWGFNTIYNTHIPRRGPMSLPFLGLSVGNKTWVLCDPLQTKPGMGNFQPPFCYNFPHHVAYLEKQGTPLSEPYLQELDLQGVEFPSEIHYWGHYPVADMEFETSAPVSVGLRAWSPFLPGDVKDSMIPGIIFEVHLRNTGTEVQKGTIAFSFPGPTALEAGTEKFGRQALESGMAGVEVQSPNATYVLGVISEKNSRLGGELGACGEGWSRIRHTLPDPHPGQSGSSAAVDFDLTGGAQKTVRFLVSWCAPKWNGGGKPWSTSGNTFTHMYAKYYPSAVETAKRLANEHDSLLRRILAWQEVLYTDKDTSGWLADSLINSLYMIAETGLWAQKDAVLPGWVKEEDGLFGMNECPRTCPQIECIPCGFYGNQPLVYFFPELALSTFRGYAGYMYEDGAAPWVWGGWTAGNPPIDFAMPSKGYQWTTNGISMAAMIDRFLICQGDQYPGFVKEFYPVIKKNMIYTANLRSSTEYTMGQRLLMMPDGDHGAEWFEAGNPAWFGMTTHAGALHLAQLRIAQRFADFVGDVGFSNQCKEWLGMGGEALERDLWNGTYYLNCFDPLSGKKDDLVFGFQLDAEWITRFHGLPGIFRGDRVKTVLETIRRCNAAISQYGVVNYAKADGTPAPVGGYGTYSWFPPEVLMLAMNFMYEGEREFGMALVKRCWENILCKWRYTWDMPNIIRGDQDTGERGFLNGGHDYYQDMMLWSLPAAIQGQDVSAPCKPGGLVDRILQAAKKGQ